MEKFTKGWVQHLRNTSRQVTPPRNIPCPLCGAQIEPNVDAFKAHVRSNSSRHPTLTGDADMEAAFRNMIARALDAGKAAAGRCRNRGSNARPPPPPPPPQQATQSGCATATKRPVSGSAQVEATTTRHALDRVNLASDGTDSSFRGSKRLCSPPASIARQRGSSPSTPRRTRTRRSDSINDFERGLEQRKLTARRLWVPDDEPRGAFATAQRPRTPQTRRHGQLASSSSAHRRPPRHRQHRRQQNHAHSQPLPDDVSTSRRMAPESDTQLSLSEQLHAEAKGIYAGLIMLEEKCIQFDSTKKTAALTHAQYHAMISLHRSLLYEHHDFFLASQHPSASNKTKRLAVDGAMPARMWQHAIHSFLELLRHHLPGSLEYMLAFMHIAYHMMALLTETVPSFKQTWVECLGDLGRYRMAIEDNDLESREVWSRVSKYWYTQASDRAPTTGRLYHHLAILARPNILQQLFFYAKSLCVQLPFESARDSIMILFDPLRGADAASKRQRLPPVYAAFVRLNGILFSGKAMDQLQSSTDQFLNLLDSRISKEPGHWLESGYHMGICLSCLLLGFGSASNVLMRAIMIPGHDQNGDLDGDGDAENEPPTGIESRFDAALSLAEKTYEIVMNRWADRNTLPFLHTTLAFYLFMSRRPAAMQHLQHRFPWKQTSLLLNHVLRTCDSPPRIDTPDHFFPGPEKGEPPHPLPEDYAMRGLVYTAGYFPRGWFEHAHLEADEKYLEPPSTVGKRRERILWIGRAIARSGRWLVWDESGRRFGVTAAYDVEMHHVAPPAGP
ncbi:hypothetical protein E4U41_000652 [Claviceps citrina]|nr:hypothetical protein E4U41_000652 [Claviceps citrina]